MANSLNFNNVKKQYFTVTLADEKKTVLMIGTPNKFLLDRLLSLNEDIKGQELTEGAVEDFYEICAQIMSRNKTGKVITPEMLHDIFDFEDIILFIHGYTDFITEVVNSKN
jgi:hypothetical protein